MEIPAQIVPLALLPEQSFTSKQAGVDAVNDWAKSYGVAITRTGLTDPTRPWR